MEDYKIEYNKLLERYYNGCKYLEENRNEIEKHLDLLLNIQNKLDIMIEKYNITDTDVILGGFKS
jgi:hypothetical protein